MSAGKKTWQIYNKACWDRASVSEPITAITITDLHTKGSSSERPTPRRKMLSQFPGSNEFERELFAGPKDWCVEQLPAGRVKDQPDQVISNIRRASGQVEKHKGHNTIFYANLLRGSALILLQKCLLRSAQDNYTMRGETCAYILQRLNKCPQALCIHETMEAPTNCQSQEANNKPHPFQTSKQQKPSPQHKSPFIWRSRVA